MEWGSSFAGVDIGLRERKLNYKSEALDLKSDTECDKFERILEIYDYLQGINGTAMRLAHMRHALGRMTLKWALKTRRPAGLLRGRPSALGTHDLLRSSPGSNSMAGAGPGVGGFRPADILLQFDRQRADGTFGLVAGAGRAEFGRDAADGRQDRHFHSPLFAPVVLRHIRHYIRSVSASLRVEYRFVSVSFQDVSDASRLCGVDYPPNLMFNQTKWNDCLHQKN
jgi:hypothetical protein